MAKTLGPGAEKVLYITDIWELLPADAQRKGRSTPLEWGKFRTPVDSSEAGLRYQMRRQAIKALPDGFAILGIFDEMLALYGFGRTATLRGWIVNHEYKLATPAQVGQAIGCANTELLAKALEMLTQVGLLMQCGLPDLATALQHDRTIRPDGPADALAKPAQPARRKGVGRERKPPPAAKGKRRKRGRRAAGQRPAAGRPPAGQEGSDGRHETRDGETPATATAAPPPPPADGNGERQRDLQTATASPPPDVEAGAVGDVGRVPGDVEAADIEAPQDAAAGAAPPLDAAASASPPPPAAAAAEPVEPTQADRGAEVETEGTARSGCNLASAETLTDGTMALLYFNRDELVLEGRKARPPQDAEEFQRRERGAIGTAWTAAVICLGQVGVVRLEQRAGKEAAAIARKRTKKPRGACWLHWFKRHMLAEVPADRWARAMYEARTGRAAGPPEGVPGCGSQRGTVLERKGSGENQ